MRVKARPVLWGCVLLLAACRQPNPEWKGADEGLATTGTPDSTGPMNTTMPVADVTTAAAPDPTTEGQDCNNDNQCPDGWICGPMGCQLGGDGDPCDGNGDCAMPTGICGPGGACQAGEAGDPCSSPSHCVNALMCTNDVCGGGGGSSTG